MKAIIFCGYHKSGKTTLMTRAVRGLTKRGHRVATVKHSPGLGVDDASAHTDSEKLFRAGSESTLLVAGEEALLTRRLHLAKRETESLVGEALSHVDADYVLIEGFKSYRGPIAKLVFVHHAKDLDGFEEQGAAAYTGFASREGWSKSIPHLPPSAGEDELADFVEQNGCELTG